MRYDTYLDEYLQALEESKEHPADVLLVQLVRLQLIVEHAAQAPWNDEQSDIRGSFRAPSVFYLNALQERMREFKNHIPPALLQNGKPSPRRGAGP